MNLVGVYKNSCNELLLDYNSHGIVHTQEICTKVNIEIMYYRMEIII